MLPYTFRSGSEDKSVLGRRIYNKNVMPMCHRKWLCCKRDGRSGERGKEKEKEKEKGEKEKGKRKEEGGGREIKRGEEERQINMFQ